MISNCTCDENGNLFGGAAGDQNKKEWAVQAWYSRPWNVVLRFSNPTIRETIAQMAEAAANNDKIGYDQKERYTFWQNLQKVGYYPEKITAKCEADCSSGVAAIVKGAGYRLKNTKLQGVSIYCYTGNLKNALVTAGATALTDSKYLTSDAYLLRGDILLYEGHHTAVNLTNGSKTTTTTTSASTSTNPSRTPKWSGKIKRVYAPRSWAGTEYSALKSLPSLAAGSTIEVCDTVKDNKKVDWYFVRMNGKTYGFIPASIVTKPGEMNTVPQWVGKATTAVYVRTGAGIEHGKLTAWPELGKDNMVDVCDSTKAKDGATWYYIRIAAKYYGYVNASYITKA